MSLCNLSASILPILQSRESVTFQEVADEIIRRLAPDTSDGENERTLRRRVYDVLNVFVAVGFAEKDYMTMRYHISPAGQRSKNSLSAVQERIHTLELDIRSKSRVLLGWLLMINRNRALAVRPDPTFSVKENLFVGFPVSPSESCDRAPDGRQLTMQCPGLPTFYSPLEVIDRLGFTDEDKSRILVGIPSLRGLIPLILPNGAAVDIPEPASDTDQQAPSSPLPLSSSPRASPAPGRMSPPGPPSSPMPMTSPPPLPMPWPAPRSAPPAPFASPPPQTDPPE
jgi:hypothetical protein